MRRKIIINEQKLKFYSINQLRNSNKKINNLREEITDKETLVNYILRELHNHEVGDVSWSCFLQELKNCIEIEYIPETKKEVIELLKPYIENNKIIIDEYKIDGELYEKEVLYVNNHIYKFAETGLFSLEEDGSIGGTNYAWITSDMYLAYLLLKNIAEEKK